MTIDQELQRAAQIEVTLPNIIIIQTMNGKMGIFNRSACTVLGLTIILTNNGVRRKNIYCILFTRSIYTTSLMLSSTFI